MSLMGHPAVDAFVAELAAFEWVSDVWLHGSLATGDHRPGVSDIDLVALTIRPLVADEITLLRRLHRRIDDTVGRRSALGCAYVDAGRIDVTQVEHPTWTHGRLVVRRLSSMVRVELLQHGQVLSGREPASVLAPLSQVDAVEAAREELTGYWSWAVRRPWLFLRPAHADLALLSMARVRHTMRTGVLLTKSEAVDRVRASRRLVHGIRRRRTSAGQTIPLAPVLGHHAWHDTRRTIAQFIQ